MIRGREAQPMQLALLMAVVAVVLVAIIVVSLRGSTFRQLSHGGYCAGMPVYAGASGPLVGRLIGPATLDRNGGAVSAVNISVMVDGQLRSVWRREGEVRKWYTPTGKMPPGECHWSRPLANHGIWSPTPFEIGLDARIWARRFGRGWTIRRTFLTSSDTI